ncbi:unnamed protein product [Brugia pahangi]|uniref:KID domain-containing protein n=1 Tax=Brugia pahangi TaxID=6280 RepID=A0A0N4TAR5_BRUPA|nr:unnamed protein product [Brugia pahangi]
MSRKSSMISPTTRAANNASSSLVTSAGLGSNMQISSSAITIHSDAKKSVPVKQERSQLARKPVNSTIKRQTTLLRQPSLETKR